MSEVEFELPVYDRVSSDVLVCAGREHDVDPGDGSHPRVRRAGAEGRALDFRLVRARRARAAPAVAPPGDSQAGAWQSSGPHAAARRQGGAGSASRLAVSSARTSARASRKAADKHLAG